MTAMSLLSLSGNKVGLLTNPRPPGDGHVLFWRSEDGGETWSAPVRATPPGTSTYVVSTDVVMRTSSGRIIVPCYVALGKERDAADRLPTTWGKLINGQWAPVSGHYSDPRFTAVYVAYSDDEGRTWRRNEDGELLIVLDWSATFTFVNEASVAEVAPGRLLMMLRTGLGTSLPGVVAGRRHDLEPSRAYQPGSEHDSGLRRVAAASGPSAVSSGTSTARRRSSVGTPARACPPQSAATGAASGSSSRTSSRGTRKREWSRVPSDPFARPSTTSSRACRRRSVRRSTSSRLTADDSPWDWRITYPRVNVMGDRVFVQYGYSRYSEHETRAEHLVEKGQRLKILPITWFYGGKEPADNPFLPSSSFVLSGE